MHAKSITCTRRIQFCAGHRVMEHESKCRHLHGHNYVCYVTAQKTLKKARPGEILDKLGRVVDFSVLKEQVGGWIERNWDHGFIIHKDDHAAENALAKFSIDEAINQKTYRLPYNPTAENIAKYILEVVQHKLHLPDIEIIKVVIDETENCSASATAT